MKSTVTTIAMLGALLIAEVASAQTRGFGAYVPSGGIVAHHHASTAHEGLLRGTADLARGIGEFNYATAQANLIHEETISRRLDNLVKATETYFERRRINREMRAYERGEPPTPEALARYARLGAPNRLQPHQFDAATGTVYWPAALSAPHFAQGRELIDQLMKNRTVLDGGFGAPIPSQIANVAEQMRYALQGDIHELRSDEYIAAKNFLRDLAYEARFAPEIRGVAAAGR